MIALQFAVRLVYDLRLRVDTDEPQHLHVAWTWTQGLVPYRDAFDNHAPLFHLAMAPLVAAFGERADLLVVRSEEHTSELQSPMYLVCRLLLEKKKKKRNK